MTGLQERRIHESTSRGLCRLAFLVLGAGPLFFAITLSVLQFVPLYHRWTIQHWEQRLEERLGFRVYLSAIETPSPTKTILRDVRMLHPENHAAIASAKNITVERFRGQWLVRIQDSDWEGRQLADGFRIFHDSVLCRPFAKEQTHVRFEQARVHSVAGPLVLEEASLKYASSTESTLAWLEFSQPIAIPLTPSSMSTDLGASSANSGQLSTAASGESKCKLSLVRYHLPNERHTHFQLSAEQAALPCSFAQLFVPSLKNLGLEAQIRGTVAWDVFPDQAWRCFVSKTPTANEVESQSTNQESEHSAISSGLILENVDFGLLCWNGPVNLVSGTGKIFVELGQVSQARLEMLRGFVMIEEGTFQTRLLQEAGRSLGFQLASEVQHQQTHDLAFKEAAFSFHFAPPSDQFDLWAQVRDGAGVLAQRTSHPQPLEKVAAWLQLATEQSNFPMNLNSHWSQWILRSLPGLPSSRGNRLGRAEQTAATSPHGNGQATGDIH